MSTKNNKERREIFVAEGFVEAGGQLLCKPEEAPTKEEDKGKDKEDKKDKTESKPAEEKHSWRYWLGISAACAGLILAVFVIGLGTSAAAFNYLERHYNLSYSFICLIICGTGILVIIIAGLAISSVKTLKKRSLGWAIILTFFLFPGIFYSIYHSRGDNFDRQTGQPLAWIVPSTGKIWRQTNFLGLKLSSVPKFSPFTGEKLVPLSTGQLQKIKRKKARRKLAALPEYRVYAPGTYYFNLGPGEITEPGIEIPVDKLYKYFLSSDDYQYVIIYDDGKGYKGGNYSIPHRYRARFKLRALKKEKIKLVITEER